MIALSELGTEVNILNLVKIIYQEPTKNVMCNGETKCINLKSQKRQTGPIYHCYSFRYPSQYNKKKQGEN